MNQIKSDDMLKHAKRGQGTIQRVEAKVNVLVMC